ncbi:hypothetical protein CN084_15665 [Sinorhizobium medicae]|nr:hypothetical protein CN084_15665 [Sinorhizobium medicae]
MRISAGDVPPGAGAASPAPTFEGAERLRDPPFCLNYSPAPTLFGHSDWSFPAKYCVSLPFGRDRYAAPAPGTRLLPHSPDRRVAFPQGFVEDVETSAAHRHLA